MSVIELAIQAIDQLRAERDALAKRLHGLDSIIAGIEMLRAIDADDDTPADQGGRADPPTGSGQDREPSRLDAGAEGRSGAPR